MAALAATRCVRSASGYNRYVKTSLVAGLAAGLALAGCNRGGDSKEAIRQGVIDHLSGRAGLDLKSMQVDVTSVSFRQGEADAVVSFRPRGQADPSAGMTMQYTLEKKGNRWVVKAKRESGLSPHSGEAQTPGGGMPPGHPPVDKGAPSGSGK